MCHETAYTNTSILYIPCPEDMAGQWLPIGLLIGFSARYWSVEKIVPDLNYLSGYLDGDFGTQPFCHQVAQIIPTVGSWDFVLRKCESLRDSVNIFLLTYENEYILIYSYNGYFVSNIREASNLDTPSF